MRESWHSQRTPYASGAIVETESASLWYHDDRGSGDPLLLLGGFAPGHFQFDFVRPYLRDFRLVTWEPRGSGPSTLDGPYTIDRWVADLHELVTALRLGRMHVWASGFSSYIALAFAARHPDETGALVTYTDVWAGDPAKGLSVHGPREDDIDPDPALGQLHRKIAA